VSVLSGDDRAGEGRSLRLSRSASTSRSLSRIRGEETTVIRAPTNYLGAFPSEVINDTDLVAFWRNRDKSCRVGLCARVGLCFNVLRRTGLSGISSASHSQHSPKRLSKGPKWRPSKWAARASALVWGGSQPVAKPSTIWYRARAGTEIYGASRNIRRFRRAVLTEPALWSHSSSPLSRGVIHWIAAVPLVRTRRVGPVTRRVGEVQA
jgi:hypothetical protein